MDNNSLIVSLIFMTLGAVLLVGIWQWFRTRHSQSKRGEHPGDVTASGADMDMRTRRDSTLHTAPNEKPPTTAGR